MIPDWVDRRKLCAAVLALILVLLAIAVLVVMLVRHLLHPGQEAEELPAGEERPALVTMEQMERLSYTDSALGELTWTITEALLEELNRVLEVYGITTAEEISQFLAQVTVEPVAGRYLTELGDEAYFQRYGYSAGTRGAGYLHLTFDYGQMAFAVWMMKRCVPGLEDIAYVNPSSHSREEIAAAYYEALQRAANLGADISRYSRIVYSGPPERAGCVTGADYIAEAFPWESAAYYWQISGIGAALSPAPGVDNTDIASKRVGGGNWQSRREAYLAFYPVFSAAET